MEEWATGAVQVFAAKDPLRASWARHRRLSEAITLRRGVAKTQQGLRQSNRGAPLPPELRDEMIAFLTGRLAFKSPTALTLDVHGVGYEVHIPLSTYYALPNVDDVTALNIHTHLREDAIQLFGFSSPHEKELFLLLTTVSGIGPKLALSVLSSLPVTELLRAIQVEDVDKLATVPGIGKKSAGRITLELKDKVGKIQAGSVQPPLAETSESDGPFEDALSALVNLGYRQHDAKEALTRVKKAAAGPMVLKNLIREGLKELARG